MNVSNMSKLYISGLVFMWHLFVVVLNFSPQQDWFLDFAYHYLRITKAGLVVQAYFKHLLMIIIFFFFGPCSYTASGHLSVENVVQVFCNTLSVLFCRRNTGILRCRLCLFNIVIKRHIALPPNLESPSPRNNHPFFPSGWRLYIS